MHVLLADGLFELRVEKITGDLVQCSVVEGGELRSRKGVNFPDLNLRLPSMTEKDKQDLEFGLTQDVDWVSLSFVRSAEDIKALKKFIEDHKTEKPIIAKIEKPQAVDHLDEIIVEAHGIMVARGDLGVEMNPEKVPMIQKTIIEKCNLKGKPVITATQMLESMIQEPRPTRAEASDVANAIIDGTDAIMLSGETAMGKFPAKAVEMMDRIARDVEGKINFKTYPPQGHSDILAITRAANLMEGIAEPTCIVVLTTSGRSARFVAAGRMKAPIFALTSHEKVYHGLNLLWGIKPILINDHPDSFEGMVALAKSTLLSKGFAQPGEKLMLLGGVPSHLPGGTNFITIQAV
jgi:pyruvate kinase